MNCQDSSEDEINKEIQEGFIKQIADKIVQGMENLENATDDVKRRWIWELLQNAKDVPNKFGGVTVIIEIFKDKLLFKHNGDSFTYKNITSLIQQVSSKDDTGDDPNVTGKFGTGFITTHLLSKKFIVYGVVKSQNSYYKKFKMNVDRDSSNSSDMMKKIKKVLDELRNLKSKEVIENYDEKRKEDDMDTIFEYPLNSNTFLTAKIGIEDLMNYLPYSLLFNPLIKKVTVFNHKNESEYSKYCVQKQNNLKRNGIELITINSESAIYRNKIEKSNKTNSFSFIMNSNEDLNIVCPIQSINGLTTFLPISENMPKLFCSFPLIGSENFYQPMVINSNRFSPNEARSTIFLKNVSSEKVCKNRELLVRANKLFEEIIQYSINNKFDNYFNLFTCQTNSNQYIDHNWVLDQLYKPRLKYLYSQPIIKTFNGKIVSINSLYFPTTGSKNFRIKFWDLNCKYFDGNVVIQEQLDNWIAVLSSTNYTINIEKFTRMISEKKSLNKLDFCKNIDEKISFINELIKLIKDTYNEHILNYNHIIPNMNNEFLSLNELKSDKNQYIPQIIKEIYQQLTQKSLDDILVHHSVIDISNIQKYKISDAITDINTCLKFCKDLKLKQKVALLMVSLISTNDRNNTKRKKIRSLLTDLGYQIDEKEFDNLPTHTWKVSDPIIFKIILNDLISISNSKQEKQVSVLSDKIHKNINDTINWLNEYFLFMEENQFTEYKKYNIIPRQNLSFGNLSKLYIDKDIPDSIKEILPDQIKPQLIDKRIQAFKNHQSLTILQISSDIKMKIEKNLNNPSEVYPFAIKLVCLQNDDCEKNKKFFELCSLIDFSILIPGITQITMISQNIDKDNLNIIKDCVDIAIKFLVECIINYIHSKNDIHEIANVFINQSQKINGYVKLIEFLYDSKLLYYYIIQNNKIFLNQNEKFILKKDAAIDESHDENLFEIAQNENINIDFKDQFVIKEIEDIVKKDDFKTIDSNFISHLIDSKIKDYRGNKKIKSFHNLIKQIWNLFQKDDKYKNMFPCTYPDIEEIAISTYKKEENKLFVNMMYAKKTDILVTIEQMRPDQARELTEFIRSPNSSDVINSINSLDQRNKQYLLNNIRNLGEIINNSRLNAETPIIRPINNNNNRFNIRLPNRNIHQFVNHVQQVHIEPYNIRIATKIKKLLRRNFTKINENEKNKNSFYCNINNNDENDFLIILKIINSDSTITLFSHDIEFANDFPDDFIIIIVPSENDFNDSNISETIKIIPKIGYDIEKLDIVNVYEQLFSINDDEFELEMKGNYELKVKEKYIDSHSLTFDEWSISLQKE